MLEKLPTFRSRARAAARGGRAPARQAQLGCPDATPSYSTRILWGLEKPSRAQKCLKLPENSPLNINNLITLIFLKSCPADDPHPGARCQGNYFH